MPVFRPARRMFCTASREKPRWLAGTPRWPGAAWHQRVVRLGRHGLNLSRNDLGRGGRTHVPVTGSSCAPPASLDGPPHAAEDVWRLPTAGERAYPVLARGLTVGVVPLVDRDHVLPDPPVPSSRSRRVLGAAGRRRRAARAGGGGPAQAARGGRLSRDPAHVSTPSPLAALISMRRRTASSGRPDRRSPARRRRRVLRAARHAAARGSAMALDDPHHGVRVQGGLARRALRLGIRI